MEVGSNSVFSSRYSLVVIWPHYSLELSTMRFYVNKVRILPVMELWGLGSASQSSDIRECSYSALYT